METFVALVLAGFVGLTGVALAVAVRRTRAFREAVRHTAETFGLGFDPGGLMRSPRGQGVVDGLEVEVRHVRERVRRRGGNNDPVIHTRIRVSGRWGKDFTASARVAARERPRRGFLASLNDALGDASERATGDPRLDAAVVVRSASRFDALSRLGEGSRTHLEALVGEGRAEVRDQTLTLKRRGLLTDAATLEGLTRAALDLGRGLMRAGRTAEEALADIVVGDPVTAVRVAALERLTAERAGHPETARAITAALAPGAPALRILAASHTGDHGFDAARDVATDPDAPLAPRCRALDLLGTRYPGRRDEAIAAIDVALPSCDDPRLATALRAAAALGHRPDLERLAAVAPWVADEAAPAYAAALAAHGVAGEPLLLALFAADDGDVKVAAARALGQVGSLGAVEPLLPHTSGVFRSRAVKAAARDAVTAIQARVGGGAAGALSLADHAGGALSLSDPEEP